MSRHLALAAAALCLACSALPVDGEAPAPAVAEEAPAPPGFPEIARWGRALTTVHDAEQAETRTVYRAPEGDVWAKVHHPPSVIDVITRIDVRRKVGGAWRYEAWDPARRTPVKVDPETCQLCHSMAPKDGTWTTPGAQ
ncbi:MAG: hypothetical protein H6706_24815 [Myxococcales bacterium]|nr:hypothetical protein [Myxococcales bacterium]